MKRIILDSVFIGPERTRDSEESRRRIALKGRLNRTGPIARWLIDLEVDGTGTRFLHEGVDHFESPILDSRVRDEEPTCAGEITRVAT